MFRMERKILMLMIVAIFAAGSASYFASSTENEVEAFCEAALRSSSDLPYFGLCRYLDDDTVTA